ncbi:hypothetical protein GXN76_16040 [Kroppenstedtia pulmonis]|uniref:MnmG N-terminal domain-containing protein n=1 Tax=Kroppenstedtia pulmonis TaxID=1380685 RepID=A0A7D4CQ52_9BACL|nr:hypothetical protein [Kroppenstedtia pulmonis]QKG85818.1 hypothetical protein GXN76_16040 [Kroppenstedtia pulmonis]
MAYSGGDYDMIIISNGQAGRETAEEAARMGKSALLIKLNPGSIASVMCSSTSVHESPHGQPMGELKAQLVQPVKDPEHEHQEIQITPISTESQHSVYILQGTHFESPPTEWDTPEVQETPDTENSETELDHESSAPPSKEQISYREPFAQQRPSTMAKPVQTEDYSASDDRVNGEQRHPRGLMDKRGQEDRIAADHNGSAQEEAHSPSSAHPLLREREMRNRRKMTQRQQLPPVKSRMTKESPLPPKDESQESLSQLPFREREIEQRRKLTRGKRMAFPPSQSPSQPSLDEARHQENTTAPEPEPEIHQEPSKKVVFPFQRKSDSSKPMDHRMQGRRPGRRRQQEALRPTSEPEGIIDAKNSDRTSKDTGSALWEAKKDSHYAEKEEHTQQHHSREWDVKENDSELTYEPFQHHQPPIDQKSEDIQPDQPSKATAKREVPEEDHHESLTPRQHQREPEPAQTREKTSPKKPQRRFIGKLVKRAKPVKPQMLETQEAPQEAQEKMQPFNQQPKSVPREPSPFSEQEAARHVLRNSMTSDTFKRDTFDVEDTFGQSYEDFMGPFGSYAYSPEKEQLERRKLALRGLHNLINNLG